MNKRPLVPAFLNRVDRKLLLSRPDTWSTRFHLVLYYALLFLAALTLVCFFLPIDPRESSYMPFVSVGVGLLAAMGFIGWLIYLLRFNVFKQFGLIRAGDRLKNFLLFYLCIALMVVSVYVPPLVETFRVNRLYTSNELATDMNRINELVARIDYDRIPKKWRSDTLIVRAAYPSDPVEIFDYDVSYPSDTGGYYRIPSTQLDYYLQMCDSVRKVNDTMYVRSSFFNLMFVNNDRIERNASVKVLHTRDLYNLVFRKYHPRDLPAMRTELWRLLENYGVRFGNADPQISDDVYYFLERHYSLNSVNYAFNNIARKKYRLQHRDVEIFVRLTHYTVLALTLLLFMFRHTTIRTFFLTLLALIILSVLSGLLAVMSGFEEKGVFVLMLLYFAAFFFIMLKTFSSSKRNYFTGIALNIILLTTVAVPVIAVGLYYEQLRDYYHSQGIYDYTFPDMDLHFLLAEAGGFVLLLVLIETLYKRLYRAWYALPEE